jgi:hypothetical protein
MPEMPEHTALYRLYDAVRQPLCIDIRGDAEEVDSGHIRKAYP